MTRDDLIRNLLERQQQMSYRDMSVAVKHLLQTMSSSLVCGQRIEVRGFGSFTIRCRAERVARNPKTGADVLKQASRVVHFKPGKELKERVNAEYQIQD